MKKLAAMALLLVACGSNDGTQTKPAQPDDGTPFVTTSDDAPEVTAEGPRSSRLRKMTVDELQASIPIVAGNDEVGEPIRWLVSGEDALGDDVFGKILGRPDYVAVTAEAELPSTLYVKFVRDMARDVCDRIVRADAVRPQSESTLWPYAPPAGAPSADQLTLNLQYLMLRFLGHKAEAGDEMLESLRAVYVASEAGYTTGSSTPQIEGWRGVCIALFEDPAFHLH